MIDLFYQLLDWVAQNPLWSGVVIFLVAMSESLAIVGLIVPGVIIMFGIGALIAAGAIEFWSAMAWAVAGAVVGDGLSFWLGRHYRDRLTAMWPFSRYPSSLEQGVAFFNKYGGKSVAFGRFFGPVRAVIPRHVAFTLYRRQRDLRPGLGSGLPDPRHCLRRLS
jgi:membrane protein DedA with SNARE-associated domain